MNLSKIQINALILATLLSQSAFAAKDDRDVNQAAQAASSLIISDAKVVDSAGYPADLLDSLSNEAKSCGLNTTGSLCLDTKLNGGSGFFSSPVYIETSDSFIFFSLISIREPSSKLALVVEVEKDSSKSAIRTASIVAAAKKLEDANPIKNDYLLGRTKKVIELSVPTQSLDFALDVLNKSPDFRKLYHFSSLILQLDTDKKNYDALTQTLSKQYKVVTQSDSPTYQLAFLKLLRASFKSQKDLLLAVSDDLLGSKSAGISQLAAITLAERGVQSDIINSKVRDSLSNSDYSMRILGIYALAKIKTGLPDEGLLIERLGDSDSDVRGAASNVVVSIQLGNDHLSYLGKVLGQSNYNIRILAIKFLGLINTAESTAMIIPRLGDSDSDVRSAANALVNKRSLSNNELTLLSAILSQNNYNVRILAVNQIGRINSHEAAQKLVTMLGDGDSDVRSAAATALNKFQLSLEELSGLVKLLNSNNYTIRILAVKFMSKIAEQPSTEQMVLTLGDSDSDVRSTTISLLKKRTLADTEVRALQTVAKNNNYSVRVNAAYFLGAIKTENATSALILMIADSDSDVRSSVVTALRGRTFTDDHVQALSGPLNSSINYNIRVTAANFLGTTSSCKARSILVDRLVNESDSDVMNAIKQALQAIKARNSSC